MGWGPVNSSNNTIYDQISEKMSYFTTYNIKLRP